MSSDTVASKLHSGTLTKIFSNVKPSFLDVLELFFISYLVEYSYLKFPFDLRIQLRFLRQRFVTDYSFYIFYKHFHIRGLSKASVSC